MKIIFLSNFYPRKKREEYLNYSKIGLSAAADAHQYAIALGLRKICEDFTIINLPAISHYPLRYKKPFIKSEIIEENGLTINNIGSCNIIEYQYISRYIHATKALKNILINTKDQVYIIVYATNIAFLKAATVIKKKYNNVKLCLILPDLPEDMNTHSSFVTQFLNKIHSINFKKPKEYYQYFDSFVLLTEYMREIVQCKKNQYIVSEGIYEEFITKRIPHQEEKNTFTLFYGGMLYEKFGIINLIKAFHAINNPRLRLQLCGYGDCINDIKEYIKKDNRIQYLGIVSREKALNLQSQASLLINPRIPDNNPFTKYSFPSKTMEYFASGTPTLLYELDGIPKEYYQYCYSLDAEHTDEFSLSQMIQKIYNTPQEERIEKGQSARRFILNEKNYLIAGEKIYNLLQKTLN